MRVGLLGPSDGDLASLARGARYLLHTAQVHHAIYLGADDALERVVATWAEALLGNDPTEDGVWRRAAELALYGTVDAIDGFVKGERQRLRLRDLRSLPAPDGRAVDMLGDRVAVFVTDKALLDEEDIAPASLLVYGRSEEPLVKKVGSRWFLTPGRLSQKGGVGVLEESESEIRVMLCSPSGQSTWSDGLTFRRGGRVRVQGEP